MKRRLALLLVLVLIIGAFGFAGCAPKAAAPAADAPAATTGDVIKIGVFEPMTGANAAGGAMEVEGAQLANKLYPEILGKKIELVVVDNKSDKVEAANAATRLIEKEKVVAIIGSWGSSLSMAAGPIAQEAQVPVVGASCTNPLVTFGNDYYFRVCFIDPFQGTVMANYAFTELKAKKAAIIQEVSNDYSVGLAKFFTDAFVQLTGDANAIVEVSSYNTGDNDFSAQLQNVAAKKPDVIFAPGNFTESAMLIKQAKEQGIAIPFLGGDTWETPEFLTVGGDAVNGAIYSFFYDSKAFSTDLGKQFTEEYTKQYSKDPAGVTALGFDAYMVVYDAIKRANSADPKAIRDAIAATKDYPGAAGIITLDENGDAVKSAVIKKVENGQFTYMTTIEPMKK